LSNASLTILLLGIAVGIRQPILQRFAALEQNLMQKKLARVADVFVQRVEKLDSSAKAEATWTEMYIYMKERDRTFYQDTYPFEGLMNCGYDVLGILDRKDNPIHLDCKHNPSDTAYMSDIVKISPQIRVLNNRWITGEIYLLNSDRQPIQILSVRSPRLEYQQGEATLNQLTGVLFLVGISLGIIISLLAKAIQQQVQNLRIEHIGSPISAYVSVSLGISSLVPEQGTAPEILIEQSDQKLGVAELWDDFVRF
jgi:sensor domain CHASE-containing protein